MMTGAMRRVQRPAMPILKEIWGCSGGLPCFSIILNVTAEKLPYRDWGCGEGPRYFPVILTVTAEKLPKLGVLLGDQVVGQCEARHRHQPVAPRRGMRPAVERHAALGHEHHAAPAADVGDGAILAHQPFTAGQRLVDEVEGRLGAGAE